MAVMIGVTASALLLFYSADPGKKNETEKAPDILPAGITEAKDFNPNPPKPKEEEENPLPGNDNKASLPAIKGEYHATDAFSDMVATYKITFEEGQYKMRVTFQALPDAKGHSPQTPPEETAQGTWNVNPGKKYPVIELHPENKDVTTIKRHIVSWITKEGQTTGFTTTAPKGKETMIWTLQ